MQNLNTITELKNRLDSKNLNDVLLDVRTPQEFAEGHIEGSVNYNTGTLDAINNLKKLDKTKTYIVYCRSGGRSSMAAMIMNQLGLTVINSKVGFMHWQAEGQKVAF